MITRWAPIVAGLLLFPLSVASSAQELSGTITDGTAKRGLTPAVTSEAAEIVVEIPKRELDGKTIAGILSMPNGERPIEITFTDKDFKLSAVPPGMEPTAPYSETKVEGRPLQWSGTVRAPDGRRMDWAGTVDGAVARASVYSVNKTGKGGTLTFQGKVRASE